jgi:hypothetical protein
MKSISSNFHIRMIFVSAKGALKLYTFKATNDLLAVPSELLPPDRDEMS